MMILDVLFLYIINCYIAGLITECFGFFPNFYTVVSSTFKKTGILESIAGIKLQRYIGGVIVLSAFDFRVPDNNYDMFVR